MRIVPGIVVRQPWEKEISIGPDAFNGLEVGGKAVLVHTGWDRHWRTDAYFGEHPFLTAEAADWLAEHGAVLVGIDSCNIDNMHVRARPVHTRLLGADDSDLRAYDGARQPPGRGFPLLRGAPKVEGMGTFPVRAYARLGLIRGAAQSFRSRRAEGAKPYLVH